MREKAGGNFEFYEIIALEPYIGPALESLVPGTWYGTAARAAGLVVELDSSSW